MAKAKCIHCTGEVVDKVKTNWGNVCQKCLDDFLETYTTCFSCKKSTKRKNAYNPPKKTTKNFCCQNCYDKYTQDLLDLDEIDKWLKKYHGLEKLNQRIYTQIKTFNRRGMTSKGILLTLQFAVNKRRLQLDSQNISIVEYLYDDAKLDYIENIKAIENAKKYQGVDLIKRGRTVAFNTSPVSGRNKKLLILEEDLMKGCDFIE